MPQKERIEAEKRIKSAIGFEYFSLEPLDRKIFIDDLKEYMRIHL